MNCKCARCKSNLQDKVTYEVTKTIFKQYPDERRELRPLRSYRVCARCYFAIESVELGEDIEVSVPD